MYNMNIGILTYHWVFNHGANLQTLSTIGFFRRMGYNPIVINWIPEDSEKSYENSTTKDQAECFKRFQLDFFPMTKLCRNARDIAAEIKRNNIEGVFIGSDTLFILRKREFDFFHFRRIIPQSCFIFPNPFWGEFLEYGVATPIVGFSIACLDTKGYQFKSIKPEICRYLKRFSYLSTRDKATSELVSYFSDGAIVPEITPDPVFLFNENIKLNFDDEKKILSKFNIKREYYLMSMPTPYSFKFANWSQHFSDIINSKGFDLFELPRQTGRADLPINQFPIHVISPIEWYVLIKNSRGYVGGLMHPIVSCIHNRIPFYSFDYYGTSFYRRLIVNKKTSKVYQVVKQCDLLDYYLNIRQRFSVISETPEEVFNKLNDFDKVKMEEAAEKMANLLRERLSFVCENYF